MLLNPWQQWKTFLFMFLVLLEMRATNLRNCQVKANGLALYANHSKRGADLGFVAQGIIVESTGRAITNFNTSGGPKKVVEKEHYLTLGVLQIERFST